MLTVEDVHLTLGHKEVLKGLNLEFEEGHIYGLVGQNGAGKSSIAYLLMGLDKYKPQRGKIIYNNEDITDLSLAERAQKGITLAWQEPARYEGISVREFLTLGGKHSLEMAEEVLKMVGLPPERYLQRDLDEGLSGGERKRIEMASVMMVNPRVVILDEPDSGIDYGSYENVLSVARALKEKGGIVIMITHNVEIFDSLDYAYLICNGIAYRKGEPGEIRHFYQQQCDYCDFVEPVGDKNEY